MAVTLAKLVANRAQAEIDFGGGDVLHVEFYPARLTGKMLQAYVEADNLKALDAARGIAVMTSVTDSLLALLASWDLADGEDPKTHEPSILPIDRAQLESLGLALQWTILNGIMAASSKPGEASAPGAQAAS